MQTGSVTLTDGVSPELISWGGVAENYATFKFNVPPGVDRLDASIAYPPGGGASVHLILVDPQGRYAANSLPQGIANFANVDVIAPIAGTWTGAIFSALTSFGGINGTIPWKVETQQFIPFATVKPSSLTLAPGASKTVTVFAINPASPGDYAGSIVVSPGLGFGEATSIPVTLRSLVQVASGGAFNGVLTGGNGRGASEQVEYFEFEVPNGVKNITANVTLSGDAGDNIGTYLISPDGDTLGFGQNDLTYPNHLSATAYTLNPVRGPWTLIVDLYGAVVGDKLSVPFTGNIEFNNVSVSAPGLPNGASHHLAAGTPVQYTVNVTNNGAAPQFFFIDPRLDGETDLALATQFGTSNTVSMPITTYPIWLMPTETASVSVLQFSNPAAMFDFSPFTGDPDLASAGFGPGTLCSTISSASYTPPGGSVTPGFWAALPTECGPYGPGGAPPGTATVYMTVTAKPFDAAVTPASGDFWLYSIGESTSFAPIEVNPGQTVPINVTFTPVGPSGTVISGALYVDTYFQGLPPYGQYASDELAVIPYAYTIK